MAAVVFGFLMYYFNRRKGEITKKEARKKSIIQALIFGVLYYFMYILVNTYVY
ncbi:MAG: hypothetical protein ACOCV3_00875 [Halanaerobiales bacterium]